MSAAAEVEIGPLTVRPLHPKVAAEAFGVAMDAPLDDDIVAAVEEALLRYGVLVFREQNITDEQQLAFTRRFGELQATEFAAPGSTADPHVYWFSNLDEAGNVLPRSAERMAMLSLNERWHTDNSFWAVPPAASILSARRIPQSGGDTFYASMTVAYNALPAQRKGELESLRAIHDYRHALSYAGNIGASEEELAAVPPVEHPLVRDHPVTGAKSLYVSSGRIREVVGLDEEEGRALAEELVAWATRPAYVYRHVWRQYDVVMWDNRCVLHRAEGFSGDEPRVMHRTTVAGDGPVV